MKPQEIEQLLRDLVSIPSATASAQAAFEEAVLPKIRALSPRLRAEKCFIPGDPQGRAVLWALLKGKGPRTIVLLHHHDTVNTFDYGDLAPLARNSTALQEEFRKRSLRPEVLEDLASGEWLFGRGSADMKGGMAIQLSLLKDFSEEDLEGNLLLLSVPDEENMSRGMLTALPLMEQLKEEYGLSYELLIDSEPHGGTRDVPNIYTGSVGKTMVVVYVRGIKSHIGHIEEGFNPLNILSRLILKSEFSADLCDEAEGEMAAAPSWTYGRDFKESYDASIPESAGGFLSFLTVGRMPSEIMTTMHALAEEAMREAIEHHEAQFEKLGIESRQRFGVHVKDYRELVLDAQTKDEARTEQLIEEFFLRLPGVLRKDPTLLPAQNFTLIEELMQVADYQKPTVILALSAPFYPHVVNDKDRAKQMMGELKDLSSDLFQDLKEVRFFMAISDLSYAADLDADQAEQVEKNLALWHKDFYEIDFEAMRRHPMEIVNIGPWGKDLHQFTERVYLPDVTERIPELLKRFIRHRFAR